MSVELDAGGRPTYIIHENVAWDFIAAGAGHVEPGRRRPTPYVSARWRNGRPFRGPTIRDFLAATGQDCLRIFDINLRQHYFDAETIAASLSWATRVEAQRRGIARGGEAAVDRRRRRRKCSPRSAGGSTCD